MEFADRSHRSKRSQRDLMAQILIDEIAGPAQLNVLYGLAPPALAVSVVPDKVIEESSQGIFGGGTFATFHRPMRIEEVIDSWRGRDFEREPR